MVARNGKHRYFTLVLVLILQLVYGKVYPSIQWNYLNPRFAEGTFHLNVLLDSKISVICPHMAISLTTTNGPQNDALYENFWIVDNSSYHSCNVNTDIAENKLLLKCEDPSSLRYEFLVFQEVNAGGGLTFKRGKTYHFLSTANGSIETLDRTSRGHCEQFNMKMQIYICRDSKDVLCSEAKPTAPSTITATYGIMQRTTIPVNIKETSTVQSHSKTLPSTTAVQVETTEPPVIPDVRELKNQGVRESPERTASLWVITIAILGVLLAVSVVLNLYLCTKHRRRRKPEKNGEYEGVSL